MNNWNLKESTMKEFSNQVSESQYSVMDIVSNLTKRIERLEQENIGLSNELYELQNSLDMKKNTYEIPETAEGAYYQMIKKGWTMSGEGFWLPPDKYIKEIQLDGLTGDLYITIPDEHLQKLGWKEGDNIEWVDNNNGTFTLKKI